MLLIRIGTPEALEQKKELWDKLKRECPFIYDRIRHTVMGGAMQVSSETGRKLVEKGYALANKVYGFN